MRIKAMLALSVLSLAAASASAGDWYGVASIGRSSIDEGAKGDIDSELIALGATGLSSSLDDSNTGYKLQLGYQFNENWALEGGYVDLGKFKYNSASSLGALNADVKATGWNIDAVGTLPINEQFSVFGKIGLIRAKFEATATGPGGSASASETESKSTWGIGGTYNFSKTVGVRAEWERFNMGDNSDVDLLSVGLAFKF